MISSYISNYIVLWDGNDLILDIISNMTSYYWAYDSHMIVLLHCHMIYHMILHSDSYIILDIICVLFFILYLSYTPVWFEIWFWILYYLIVDFICYRRWYSSDIRWYMVRLPDGSMSCPCSSSNALSLTNAALQCVTGESAARRPSGWPSGS